MRGILIIPAKAGIQPFSSSIVRVMVWTPAFAGVTNY